MTAPAEKPAEAPGLTGAAERLRQAAKWLVVAFGAVAAVVFTGIGISSFGKLDPDTETAQFLVALAGAVVAVGGTLAALITAMNLAAASSVSMADLTGDEPTKTTFGYTPIGKARTELAASSLLAPWDGDQKRFKDSVEEAITRYHSAAEKWSKSADPKAVLAEVEMAGFWHTHIADLEQAVLHMASYVMLQARFKAAAWFFAVELGLAVLGGIGFVWATSAPATENVPTAASTGQWNVPADQREAVVKQLGTGCGHSLDAVPVVVIGSQADGKEFDVVTDHTGSCAAVRLTVAKAELTR